MQDFPSQISASGQPFWFPLRLTKICDIPTHYIIQRLASSHVWADKKIKKIFVDGIFNFVHPKRFYKLSKNLNMICCKQNKINCFSALVHL